MSSSRNTTGAVGLFIFVLMMNVFFSLYSYALTNFTTLEQQDYQIALDEELLLQKGIMLHNATSYNLTFNGPLIEFEHNDVRMRVNWKARLGEDSIQAFKQRWVEKFLDTWFYLDPVTVTVGDRAVQDASIWNTTIVQYFDPKGNWTKVNFDTGFIGFISTTPADENNITKAVYETGRLVFTIGEPVIDEFNFAAFVSWYWDLMFGVRNAGLPSSIGWIVRIVFTINVISGTIMAKELLRL